MVCRTRPHVVADGKFWYNCHYYLIRLSRHKVWIQCVITTLAPTSFSPRTCAADCRNPRPILPSLYVLLAAYLGKNTSCAGCVCRQGGSAPFSVVSWGYERIKDCWACHLPQSVGPVLSTPTLLCCLAGETIMVLQPSAFTICHAYIGMPCWRCGTFPSRISTQVCFVRSRS